MRYTKKMLVFITLIVFIVIDLWTGMTYNMMDLGSMTYLATFILIIAGIFLLNQEHYKKFLRLFTYISVTFLLIFIVTALMSSKVLNAKRYANVIGTIEYQDFDDLYGNDHDVEMSYVDKESALLSAEKKLGELSNVSARFSINEDEFSQINVKGEMVRVAPFQYSDRFKQLLNFNKGIPYYVKVVTGAGQTNAQSEIVELKEPMKYYPTAPLHFDLKRHVAFRHKFSYLDGWDFEIDDHGHPFWIVRSIKKEVGLWGAKNMHSIIIVDAVSGNTEEYNIDNIPKWVDQVYPTEMLLNHAQDHYLYANGYINARTQQEGVRIIDKEVGHYNYVSIDEELFVFTGLRPVTLAEGSTTGLLFMSTKTGQAIVLDLPGVSLKTAEMSAIGSIQEKNYTPITPVLQNVLGHPTYVMSLKDQAGVIRGFSFVNYQDYSKSSVGNTLDEARKNYSTLLEPDDVLISDDFQEKTQVIEKIAQVQIDGTSYYYLMFEDDDVVYHAKISLDDYLPFYQVGDRVKIRHNQNKILSIDQE